MLSIVGGMDLELAKKLVAAPKSVQHFVMGALWAEVEKLSGAERANDLVRRALDAAQLRERLRQQMGGNSK